MKDANADTEGFSDDVNGHCTASGCVAPEHCNCATDNSTCTHYDPRARKNATHWYCQDVPRGNQLSLDGELYGGRYGTSGLE